MIIDYQTPTTKYQINEESREQKRNTTVYKEKGISSKVNKAKSEP